MLPKKLRLQSDVDIHLTSAIYSLNKYKREGILLPFKTEENKDHEVILPSHKASNMN